MSLGHNRGDSNTETVIYGQMSPVVRDIYQVSRHLRTFHRMWLIHNSSFGALCRQARPTPVEWRCDVPFFYSHAGLIACQSTEEEKEHFARETRKIYETY